MKKLLSKVCIGGLIMLSVSACNPFASSHFSIKQPLREVCSTKNQEVIKQYGWNMKCDLFGNGTQANITIKPESRTIGEVMLLCKSEKGETTCEVYHNTLFK
jgi:hypothetical protein